MTYLYAGLLGMALAVTVRIGLPGLPLLLAVAGLLVMRILRTLRRRDQDLEPRNDVERWIFGTCANWALYNCPWDIHSRHELLETVTYMSTGPGFQKCRTKADQAWELCRCTQLLAIAFRLGWISRRDMVRRSCRVGRLIQRTFSGWQEMSESFLARCLLWMEDPSPGADMRRAIHKALWLRPDSPYNLPWDLPLN